MSLLIPGENNVGELRWKKLMLGNSDRGNNVGVLRYKK